MFRAVLLSRELELRLELDGPLVAGSSSTARWRSGSASCGFRAAARARPRKNHASPTSGCRSIAPRGRRLRLVEAAEIVEAQRAHVVRRERARGGRGHGVRISRAGANC